MEKWKKIRQLWTPFSESYASSYAAGASFYLMVSILPTALFLISLLPENALQWQQGLYRILPEQISRLTEWIMNAALSGGTTTVLSISALTTVWSASKWVLSITDGLNAVLRLPRESRFLHRRVNAALYFLLLSVCLLLMLGALVFGDVLLKDAVGPLRYGGAWIVLSVFFALLYRFLPAEKIPMHFCWAGGLCAAAAWSIFSWIFSIYVSHFSSYPQLYGAIGFFLLACIWLQICILFLLYGGLLAKLLFQKAYHPIRILRDIFSS